MPPTGLGLSGTNILPPRAAIGEHATAAERLAKPKFPTSGANSPDPAQDSQASR